MKQRNHVKRKYYVLCYNSERKKIVHGWPAVLEERSRSKEAFVFHGYHTLEGAEKELRHSL